MGHGIPGWDEGLSQRFWCGGYDRIAVGTGGSQTDQFTWLGGEDPAITQVP